MHKTQVIDSAKAKRILDRMAMEIIERNSEKKPLILVGIAGTGLTVAKNLFDFIQNQKYEKLDAKIASLTLDKRNPNTISAYDLSTNTSQLEGSTIILIDDVLNSGRTLMYAASYLLQFNPSELQTAIFVDRIHRKFPIKADIAGHSLSTTIQEHISVEVIDNKIEAYLN
jgi:pyrimidine operon attenuation protein/uracil phosphoribosyltransferase